MTTLTSLVLIVLILMDMYIFRQLDKHEIAIVELLKKNGMITRRDIDDE